MTADPSATTSARRSGSCAGNRGSTACWNRATRRSRHCSARPSSSRVRSHSQSASCQLARRSGQRSPVAAAGRARARRPAASRGGRAGSFLRPGVQGAGQALAASRTSFSNATATSARGWQPMASQMSKHIRSGSAESPSANTTSRSMSLLFCSSPRAAVPNKMTSTGRQCSRIRSRASSRRRRSGWPSPRFQAGCVMAVRRRRRRPTRTVPPRAAEFLDRFADEATEIRAGRPPLDFPQSVQVALPPQCDHLRSPSGSIAPARIP